LAECDSDLSIRVSEAEFDASLACGLILHSLVCVCFAAANLGLWSSGSGRWNERPCQLIDRPLRSAQRSFTSVGTYAQFSCPWFADRQVASRPSGVGLEG